MFVKLAFASLLTVSVACFSQVTVMGGYATPSGPAVTTIPGSAVNPPIVSTPDIALPGSGPAVGVPLSNTNTNDSRGSTGPSISNPNSIILPGESTDNFANEAPVAPSSAAPSPNSGPFEFGIQQYGLETAPVNSAVSLGEIAKRYRAQHHQAVRTFTNDNIARLIAVAFQPGPLSAATQNQMSSNALGAGMAGNVAQSSSPLIAGNRVPDLPQNDHDNAALQLVEVAMHSNATAGQQRHPADDQTVPDRSSSQPAATQTASSMPDGAKSQKHYSLPLLLLIGGLGVACRALFLILR